MDDQLLLVADVQHGLRAVQLGGSQWQHLSGIPSAGLTNDVARDSDGRFWAAEYLAGGLHVFELDDELQPQPVDCIHRGISAWGIGNDRASRVYAGGRVEGEEWDGQAICGGDCDDNNPDPCQVVDVDAGEVHTCVLLDTGGVRCWGTSIGYSELIGDDETPACAGDVALGGAAVQITAGAGHTCALMDTGGVRCWGSGTYGGLGYGSTETIGDDEPITDPGEVDVGGAVVLVDAGWRHTCVVLDTGALRCWGRGSIGRLGHGNEDDIGDDEVPATAGNVEIAYPVIP